MDSLKAFLAWLQIAGQDFVGIVSDARFIPAAFLTLLALAIIMPALFVFAGARRRRRDEFKRRLAQFEKTFPPEKVRFYALGQVNRTVAMTPEGLQNLGFKDGDTASLYLNFLELTSLKQYVSVTLRTRRPNAKTKFDKDSIQVSYSVISAFGVDVDKKDIARCTLKPPKGFDKFKAQTYQNPDQSIRLAWILAFWSFIASTLAGFVIAKLPF